MPLGLCVISNILYLVFVKNIFFCMNYFYFYFQTDVNDNRCISYTCTLEIVTDLFNLKTES